ncbi:MAG: hypothetical protein WDA71_11495 [Actinomycetota bacterium]
MHRVLAQANPDADLAAMIVWIEMLPEDRVADVTALAGEMSDPRIRWFHDPSRRAGRAIAASLGAAGQVAWDVYLYFDADAEWRNQLPAPRQWAHQLDDAWADPTRHHFGDQLEPELGRLLKSILGQ